jgi:hypothetical protein
MSDAAVLSFETQFGTQAIEFGSTRESARIHVRRVTDSKRPARHIDLLEHRTRQRIRGEASSVRRNPTKNLGMPHFAK